MDQMLVVVFDNEVKASEGRRALWDLDRQGHVTIHAVTVLAKRADGTTFVLEGDDLGIVGSLVGTSLGTLIGMLGGPAGMAIGGTAGLALGAGIHLDHLRIGEDFIDDVTEQLSSGKAAVVAEIEEDWTAPVDSRMELLGGSVFRHALSEVRHTVNERAIATMRAELAQLTAEHAQASADRKAELAKKMNQLDSRIQAQLQKAKERRKAAGREAQSKADTLRAKAAAAKAAVSR